MSIISKQIAGEWPNGLEFITHLAEDKNSTYEKPFEIVFSDPNYTAQFRISLSSEECAAMQSAIVNGVEAHLASLLELRHKSEAQADLVGPNEVYPKELVVVDPPLEPADNHTLPCHKCGEHFLVSATVCPHCGTHEEDV